MGESMFLKDCAYRLCVHAEHFGPNDNPCGTTDVRAYGGDSGLFIETCKDRSSKYDLTQLSACPRGIHTKYGPI